MVTFTMTRDGETMDFTYTLEGPRNVFVQYVRTFLIFRRWTFVRVSNN